MINNNHTTKTVKSKQTEKTLTPKEVIQLVVDNVPLTDGLERYLGVNLSGAKGGRTKFIKCPFHSEKKASFAFTPKENKFHCFSCQEKGDIVTLVSILQNVSQARAAYLIAADYNLSVKTNKQLKRSISQRILDKEKAREMLQTEQRAFNLLWDFERQLNRSISRIQNEKDFDRFGKLYHLKADIERFLDLLEAAEDMSDSERIKLANDSQEFIKNKIYPVIKSVLSKIEGAGLNE